MHTHKLKSLLYRLTKSAGVSDAYIKANFLLKRWLKIKPKGFDALHGFYSRFVTPGSLVFYIGTNVGNRADVFAALGGTVVCVEPNPKLVRILALRFRNRGNITILNRGCGEKPGLMAFRIATNHLLSSFSPRFIEHKRTMGDDRRWNTTINVEIETLDRLIAQYGTPEFCKIDVEGFEKEVLSGLSQKAGCISFEFNSPTFNDDTVWCLNRLAASGYSSFNVSFGETLSFEFAEWVTAAEMATFVETDRRLRGNSYGDIYAR